MTEDEKFDKFIEEMRAFYNELCKRGCSETYMDSLYFGYSQTKQRDMFGIGYEVCIINPETHEWTDMTKEQFQKYLDEIGEVAYSHVGMVKQLACQNY